MLPLRGTVVFPLTVVPLAAAQPRSLRLIDEVMSGDRTVALVMQKARSRKAPAPASPRDRHDRDDPPDDARAGRHRSPGGSGYRADADPRVRLAKSRT